jgi:hypothetical protein
MKSWYIRIGDSAICSSKLIATICNHSEIYTLARAALGFFRLLAIARKVSAS